MSAKTKTFDLVTIFPKILDSYFNESLFKRAQKNKLLKVQTHDLRNWITDKHKTVDDRPYGGGAGLVFKVEPIYKALKSLKALKPASAKLATGAAKNSGATKSAGAAKSALAKTRVILMAANGRRFTQKDAECLARYDRLVFICPRYEGADARVEKFVDEKISIGDYVLAGGELAAAVVIEAVSRHIPGFVGKEESVRNDSFSRQAGKAAEPYLEHPQYTRPEVFVAGKKKLRAPKALLSGNHQEILSWRAKHEPNWHGRTSNPRGDA